MPEERLKQFEKSLKDKIDELNDLSKKRYQESNQWPRALLSEYNLKVKGCQIALEMLYETYPELKKDN